MKNLSRNAKKNLIALIAIAIFAGITAILHANLLLPWQDTARENMRAMKDYVNAYYPGGKIVKKVINTGKLIDFSPHFFDGIYIQYDGVEFYVSAKDGVVDTDTYVEEKMIQQFDKIIKDSFITPREIDANVRYSFHTRECYPFKGVMSVYITTFAESPEDAGWLYDFYRYWEKEGEFLEDYTVHLTVIDRTKRDVESTYKVSYPKGKEFFSEKVFYSTFKWHTEYVGNKK